MEPTEATILRLAGLHATAVLAGWLLRANHADLRRKIRTYKVGMPTDTAIRAAILETLGTIPLPPGDRLELVIEAIQTFHAVINWDEVDRIVSRDSSPNS